MITETIDVSPQQLLRQFISNNEYIYYEPFRVFCRKQNVVLEYCEFLDLLSADQSYMFNEYSDETGRYWSPAIIEGYVLNATPGDFGDDQIEGITKPAFGDGAEQQPLEFDPLSNDQIGSGASESEPDEGELEPEENPDLPDFDTRMRHRPSRSVKELESYEPDGNLIEQDNGPLISKLYGLVDTWQNGGINQQTFESELNKIATEPTLRNSSVDVWPMVQRILAAKSQRGL